MNFLYKRILLAYLLLVDKFTSPKLTLEEKFLPQLHPHRPILIQHEGQYLIFLNEWLNNQAHSSIRISYSFSSQSGFQEVSFQENSSFFTLDIPINSKRIFIKMASSNQEIIIGEQLLNVKGVVNFRDVGGYRNAQNEMVQFGKIFRSGHLYKLGKSDHEYFKSLNISTIIDFRGHDMARKFPDKVPNAQQINFIHLPIESKGLEMRQLGRKILKDDMADFDAKAILMKAYKSFIQEHTAEVKMIFKAFLEAKGGVLMHCSAGKDRTGFSTALILKTLGVNDATIMEDFLASNFYRKRDNDGLAQKAQLFTNPAPLLPLIQVQEAYLRTAFEEIDAQFGFFEEYLKNEIQLSTNDIQQLRAKYLSHE